MMTSISDLPVELLLDHLLTILPVLSLLALGATNHRFASVCKDETIWKLKCKEDFNFSSSRTARTSGWKYIYSRLSNPKVYVWGDSRNGRLGVPRAEPGGMPYPMQLRFPKGTAIVDLSAGGWSFHALDSKGRVFVWGTLHGEGYHHLGDGFQNPSRTSETPLQLQLPTQIRALSCGRMHSMALDSRGQIWNFLSWGRPFRLATPLLDLSSPDETPVQAECGWSFSAALTASGTVLVWWPFGRSMQHAYNATMRQMNEAGDKQAHATADGKIPCVTWDMQRDPFRLLPLPSLPELSDPSHAYESERQETKLVKIAAMDNVLIGLTNKGHVLKFGNLRDETTLQYGRWEYLPFFSETEKVRAHPTFAGGVREAKENQETLSPPTNLKITHISAHFRQFVVYTTEVNSVVLRGSTNTAANDEAEIIPALQYKSIISVVLGDYHNAALTAEGKLFAWGSYSAGALGLGNPVELPAGAPGGYATQVELTYALRQGYHVEVRKVEVPTEVRFDHGEKKGVDRFCFAATAAGWHTGALVIDLEPEDEEDEGQVEEVGEESNSEEDPVIPLHRVPRYHAPPFRVGFSGRGLKFWAKRKGRK